MRDSLEASARPEKQQLPLEMKSLLESNFEEEHEENTFRPSYQRDTINSFYQRAFAKRIHRPPYDKRHEDAIYKKCHIAMPHYYKDPEQDSITYNVKPNETKRRKWAKDNISRTIDFQASVSPR